MAEKTLNELFLETLKDMYFAERQILKTLPRLAKVAGEPELKRAFETHRDETEKQIERIEQIFEQLGKAARAKTCESIKGILEEGEEIIEEFKGSPALDAGITAAAQAVEHYEIARYGALKTWARDLGLSHAVKLLDDTLQEEKKADQLLTKIAESSANKRAA
jgi:ferritin-like metal-binding protein YciE